MKLAMLVNDPIAVNPIQTTAMLAHAAAARGWTLHVVGIDGLSLDPDDRILATARVAQPTPDLPSFCERLAAQESQEVDLAELDAVLIRTNPARPSASPASHEFALWLLAIHADRGGLVLNDPIGLMRAASKLYLASLPQQFRPRTLVSRDPARLRAFVQQQGGRSVLKPLKGTRGSDVFFVDARQPDNLSQIIDVLVRSGVAMAQAFAPGAEDGDVRLVVLDGEPLVLDGRVAAIHRRPGEGELRSNIAQGGSAHTPASLEGPLAVARAVGARLVKDGIWLAGLDVIGDQCVEINVFSTGGLRDANRFGSVDFTQPILDALQRRVAAG